MTLVKRMSEAIRFGCHSELYTLCSLEERANLNLRDAEDRLGSLIDRKCETHKKMEDWLNGLRASWLKSKQNGEGHKLEGIQIKGEMVLELIKGKESEIEELKKQLANLDYVDSDPDPDEKEIEEEYNKIHWKYVWQAGENYRAKVLRDRKNGLLHNDYYLTRVVNTVNLRLERKEITKMHANRVLAMVYSWLEWKNKAREAEKAVKEWENNRKVFVYEPPEETMGDRVFADMSIGSIEDAIDLKRRAEQIVSNNPHMTLEDAFEMIIDK